MHLQMLTFTLSLMMCLGPLSTALAHPVGPGAAYVVTVEDGHGRRLRTFHQGGQTFVLGEYGTRYVVRVRNQTGRRIEAVITVDGRDVISGGPGDYVQQRGYVIDAHDSVVVEGFRSSQDTVAAFRFTHPGDSYSSRMGTPQHVGVIGVAVFPERRRIHRPRPRPVPYRYDHQHLKRHGHHGRSGGSGQRARDRRASSSAAPAPSADALGSYAAESAESAAPPVRESRSKSKIRGGRANGYAGSHDMDDSYASAPQRNLGTRYGERRDSRVHEVAFRRQNQRHPQRVITLHYDDRSGLRARGIRLWNRPPVVQHDRAPQPFPYNRFAPPPPG